jgi:hypothetical protein
MELTQDPVCAQAERTSDTLYDQLLGAAFERLPALIRCVHDPRAQKLLFGRCRIRRGTGALARMIASAARLPPTDEDAAVSVLIERRGTTEVWTRRFGSHEMKSRLRLRDGALEERLGAVLLTFDLVADSDRIAWRLRRARLWLLPLPLAWLKECTATESVINGRYCFDMRAQLAGVGLIAHYSGWLAEHE